MKIQVQVMSDSGDKSFTINHTIDDRLIDLSLSPIAFVTDLMKRPMGTILRQFFNVEEPNY